MKNKCIDCGNPMAIYGTSDEPLCELHSEHRFFGMKSYVIKKETQNTWVIEYKNDNKIMWSRGGIFKDDLKKYINDFNS